MNTFKTTGMVAIVTEYRGPTDTRGARIRVQRERCKAKTYPYPHELDQGPAHAHCAQLYAQDSGLTTRGHWIGGGTPDETGYAFVYVGGADE